MAAIALAMAAGLPAARATTGERLVPQAPPERAASGPRPGPAADSGIRGLDRAQRRADGALVIRGRLSGQGAIRDRGHRVIEGTVAPGDSPGCVTDHGNVTFTGTSTLEIEIAGPVPCVGHDRYTVQQRLTLQSSRLRVVLLAGFVPAAGQRFDILDWGTLSGTFGTLDLPALPAPLSWDTGSLYPTGELVVAAPAAGDVPLPAWALSLLAVVLGSALFAWAPRRA